MTVETLILPYNSLTNLPTRYMIDSETSSKLVLKITYKTKEELASTFIFDVVDIERLKNVFDDDESFDFLVSFEKMNDSLKIRNVSTSHRVSGYIPSFLEKVFSQILVDANLLLSDYFPVKFDWEKYLKEVSSFCFEENISNFSSDFLYNAVSPFTEAAIFNPSSYCGTVLVSYYSNLSSDRYISIHLTYEDGPVRYTVYGVGIDVIERFDTLVEAYNCVKQVINKYRIRNIFKKEHFV